MRAIISFAVLQTTRPPGLWAFGVGAAVGLLAIAIIGLFLMRRYFRNARTAEPEEYTIASGNRA